MVFAGEKSELIHFNKGRKQWSNPVNLAYQHGQGSDVIQPAPSSRFLGDYLCSSNDAHLETSLVEVVDVLSRNTKLLNRNINPVEPGLKQVRVFAFSPAVVVSPRPLCLMVAMALHKSRDPELPN
jgi:hypothetical protein